MTTNDIVLDEFGSKKNLKSISNEIEENRKILVLSLNECNEKKETFNKVLKLTKKALVLTKN